VFALDGHAGCFNDRDVQLGGHRGGNGSDGFTNSVGFVVRLKTRKLAGLTARTLGDIGAYEQTEII
jgi:hypothetical protein